jgi:aspartyl/glutamyl-tRNA(Asn/Gln) amidotransferase C subunit
MIHVTKEEILKLAQAANLSLSDEEIPVLVKRIEEVLSYAAYLQEFHQTGKSMPQLSNIVREDIEKNSSVELLLALAPEVEENFYVVPAILKQ